MLDCAQKLRVRINNLNLDSARKALLFSDLVIMIGKFIPYIVQVSPQGGYGPSLVTAKHITIHGKLFPYIVLEPIALRLRTSHWPDGLLTSEQEDFIRPLQKPVV